MQMFLLPQTSLFEYPASVRFYIIRIFVYFSCIFFLFASITFSRFMSLFAMTVCLLGKQKYIKIPKYVSIAPIIYGSLAK